MTTLSHSNREKGIRWHDKCNRSNPKHMKALNTPLDSAVADEIVEVDAFTTSMAPVNRTEKLIFGIRDRLCCVGLLAAAIVVMRFLFSN